MESIGHVIFQFWWYLQVVSFVLENINEARNQIRDVSVVIISPWRMLC